LANTQTISAAQHNFEQDHFFENTPQDTDRLEYIKMGGLQEDPSKFWERINLGFFDNCVDHTQLKILRNFYKLNPENGAKLARYHRKK